MPPNATALVDYLNAAKSPYHAARAVIRALQGAGYVEFDECASWSPEPGMRGFVQRGGASVVAFEVGRRPPAESGYLIVGAHTDSPNLRVKPNYRNLGAGVVTLSVEPYGGLLLSTWLDRPLCLAGRVVTRGGEVVLIEIDRPLLTIPSLAIHLQRDVNTQGLVLNPQQHLRPLLGIDPKSEPEDLLQHLVTDAMRQACLSPETADFASFDLCLLDATAASFLGDRNEFVASGRIDNLVSCCAGTHALLDSGPPINATRVLVLYDHEEIGSRSFAGAQSNLLGNVLDRLAQRLSPSDPEAAFRAGAASLLLSADMAHALHPNFPDKHDELHRPLLGRGPVLKTNVNQAYATDAVSAAALEDAASRANVTLQRFVTRSDMPCGSTIGPLSAARQGIRTVDVGNPMLAMHSCRELCASADFEPYVRLLTEWYRTERSHRSQG